MVHYIKTFSIFTITFLLLQSIVSAAPTSRPITVNIDGSFITSDTKPFIQSGRVYIPVRILASLGLTYSWDSESHTVTITDSAKSVFKMTQGQRTAYKNGQPVYMDSEVNNYNGRLMVPARFVSDAFGYMLYYEKTRGILFVSNKDYTPDLSALKSSNLLKARLTAISLPITYSFKPDKLAETDQSQYYSYAFISNDAARYIYSNGSITTVVEINNGVAKAVWQSVSVNIPGYDLTTLGGERPDYMDEMIGDYFSYSKGEFIGYYRLSDGSTRTFKYQAKNYGEIIQPIPESTDEPFHSL